MVPSLSLYDFSISWAVIICKLFSTHLELVRVQLYESVNVLTSALRAGSFHINLKNTRELLTESHLLGYSKGMN